MPLTIKPKEFCLRWLPLICLAMCSACAPKLRAPTYGYCEPPVSLSDHYQPAQNTDSLMAAYPDLPGRFSRHDLLVANATGTLPLLHELVHATDAKAVRPIRAELMARLILAVNEIGSVSAELDCEGERADQLASYLDRLNDRRTRRLTVASIVAGAVTTLLTVAVSSDQGQKIIGFSGGIASAGLGALTLVPGRKIRLEHPRNPLRDLWDVPGRSTVYSPFIWYMLTEKSFSNEGTGLARSIRKRWAAYEFDGSRQAIELYFGNGGWYAADDLHTRANLLNQLQSSIRALHQDLQSLMLTVTSFSEK